MLNVNENDIDVADMLTQYVEDLENKTASLEDKILVQQKELRQKKFEVLKFSGFYLHTVVKKNCISLVSKIASYYFTCQVL